MLRSLLLLSLLLASPLPAETWEKLNNCKLVKSAYADGDSFHIKQGSKEYIIRLYFVDTPEPYRVGGFHARTDEQAKYFNIYKKDLYTIAKEASEYTAEILDDRFTVWTCWQNAKGQSKLPRHFGIVITAEGEDLAELLIKKGYARIYGAKPEDPPLKSTKRILKDMDRAEEKAQKSKAGAWAYAKK